jgi:uncharacterized protein (DUF1501 family)
MRQGDCGVTRREFLRTGSAAAAGLTLGSLASAGAAPRTKAKHCIILFLVGGPSQLETFDPKPDAPTEIRGPFRPIRTSVPGIHLSEHLPRMARLMDRIAIIRTVHHDAQPIHETGQQLLQTGRLSHGGVEHPHVGAILSHALGRLDPAMPAAVVVPTPIGNTGVAISHGQSAGWLGSKHAPVCLEPVDTHESHSVEERYGQTAFGRACLQARQLVEEGVRVVTVNMFDTVFNERTWDCHADGGSLASTFEDYKTTLCPMFDQAYAALLEDLSQRGLLDETLVVAMGEFGRTPQVNYRGGRDHWTHCWSVLFAGGGVRGGQVIGRSDAHAAEPLDRAVHAAAIAATILHACGVDGGRSLPGPAGHPTQALAATPVSELF